MSERENIHMTPVDYYIKVIKGELNHFPAHFWDKPYGLKASKEITKYLLEDLLGFTREEICTKVTARFLAKHYLKGMLDILFNGSVYKAIDNAYPKEYQPWELKRVTAGYWEYKTHVKKAVRWLVKNKLDNSRERVINEFNDSLLVKNNMCELTKRYRIWELLALCYPRKYKPWELKVSITGYWSKETAAEAVRWLVETKLDGDRIRVCREFSTELIKSNGLATIYSAGKRFGVSNLFQLLDNAYPNKYKPWELSKCPPSYWEDENNVREAVKWLVDTELNGDITNLESKLTARLMRTNGLVMLTLHKQQDLLHIAYPDKY